MPHTPPPHAQPTHTCEDADIIHWARSLGKKGRAVVFCWHAYVRMHAIDRALQALWTAVFGARARGRRAA